jgi:hypothetical protein
VFDGDDTSLPRLVATVNAAARVAAGLPETPVHGDGASFGDDAAHLVLELPRWRDLGHAVEARLARLGASYRGVQDAAEADARRMEVSS